MTTYQNHPTIGVQVPEPEELHEALQACWDGLDHRDWDFSAKTRTFDFDKTFDGWFMCTRVNDASSWCAAQMFPYTKRGPLFKFRNRDDGLLLRLAVGGCVYELTTGATVPE